MVVISRENSPFSLSAFLTDDAPASFLLSWVAGFVDTASFIILFDLFTAHVTGNLALAGASFAQSDEGSTITRLLMIPTFIIAVALTSLLARYARRQKWPVLAVLLSAEAIALAIFLLVGTSLSAALLLDVQEDLILPIGATGVIAMAIQNALMKEAKDSFTGYFPTTVMTGNVTQFTLDLVQILSAKFSKSSDARSAPETVGARSRMGRSIPILTGFFLGASAAAYFVPLAEFWSIAFPLAVVCILAIAAYVQGDRTIKS